MRARSEALVGFARPELAIGPSGALAALAGLLGKMEPRPWQRRCRTTRLVFTFGWTTPVAGQLFESGALRAGGLVLDCRSLVKDPPQHRLASALPGMP